MHTRARTHVHVHAHMYTHTHTCTEVQKPAQVSRGTSLCGKQEETSVSERREGKAAETLLLAQQKTRFCFELTAVSYFVFVTDFYSFIKGGEITENSAGLDTQRQSLTGPSRSLEHENI